ncbi:MAG: hypothetical protein ABGW90_11730 [Martelella sp.]
MACVFHDRMHDLDALRLEIAVCWLLPPGVTTRPAAIIPKPNNHLETIAMNKETKPRFVDEKRSLGPRQPLTANNRPNPNGGHGPRQPTPAPAKPAAPPPQKGK